MSYEVGTLFIVLSCMYIQRFMYNKYFIPNFCHLCWVRSRALLLVGALLE